MKLSVSAKVTIGYLFFLLVLALCIWLVYDNIRTSHWLGTAEELAANRRDVTDSLVYSLLDANNRERAIYLGSAEEWDAYEQAVERTQDLAERLKRSINDTTTYQKIDSLRWLLDQKLDNTLSVMTLMANGSSDSYVQRKVEQLRERRDSVVVRPKSVETKQDSTVVVEVVKTRKGFFRRLADAFRKPRTDTVKVTKHEGAQETDSVIHNIDVSDSVATVLSQIQEREEEARERRVEKIRSREERQQRVGVELTRRTAQLLEEIRDSERRELRDAIGETAAARYGVMRQMGLLGGIAVLSSLVLLYLVGRDVRQSKRYSEHLEEAKADTERLMAQRERLLLTITHDIKAPAASISGFIELLREHVKGQKAASYLRNIQNSATHLLQLVRALLDYHRLESGSVEVQEASFSPSRLLESCVEEMRPMARERGLRLTCDTQGCPQKLFLGDAFRMRQIVDNLLNNALKYTSEGGVSVKGNVGNGYFHIEVADTGRGMSPEESRKVFQAFTRLANAQGEEGVGLGLSITKELTQLLNGTITLSSQKGKGTTFFVTLPVKPAPADAEAEEEAPLLATARPVLPPAREGKGKKRVVRKVMILDDDGLQLRLTTELLRRLSGDKWQLKAFQRVGEAVAWAKAERPDLICVDIEMPEMNGMEVLHRYPELKQATCLAMTAHDASIAPSLRLSGFDACLFKPIDREQLLRVLSPLVEEMPEEEAPSPRASHLDALTAFADGDKEAEREILESFRQELESYLSQLAEALKTDSREPVSKVAHKSLPTFHVIQSPVEETLKTLSPEEIGKLDNAAIEGHVLEVMEEMRRVLQAVKERLGD